MNCPHCHAPLVVRVEKDYLANTLADFRDPDTVMLSARAHPLDNIEYYCDACMHQLHTSELPEAALDVLTSYQWPAEFHQE